MCTPHHTISLWYRIPFNTVMDLIADETTLSQSLVDYWTNFAKTGDPNRATLDTDTTTPTIETSSSSTSALLNWPQYQIGSDQVMHFATPNNYVQTGLLKDYCNVTHFIIFLTLRLYHS
jgi:carboxylesterase type B